MSFYFLSNTLLNRSIHSCSYKTPNPWISLLCRQHPVNCDFEAARLSKLRVISRPGVVSVINLLLCVSVSSFPNIGYSHLNNPRFMHLLVVLVPVWLWNHWKLQGLRSPWLNLWLAAIGTSEVDRKGIEKKKKKHLRVDCLWVVFSIILRMWSQQSDSVTLKADRKKIKISSCLVLKHGHGGDDCVCGTLEWNMMMEQ